MLHTEQNASKKKKSFSEHSADKKPAPFHKMNKYAHKKHKTEKAKLILNNKVKSEATVSAESGNNKHTDINIERNETKQSKQQSNEVIDALRLLCMLCIGKVRSNQLLGFNFLCFIFKMMETNHKINSTFCLSTSTPHHDEYKFSTYIYTWKIKYYPA